jgi:hypothetical protein
VTTDTDAAIGDTVFYMKPLIGNGIENTSPKQQLTHNDTRTARRGVFYDIRDEGIQQGRTGKVSQMSKLTTVLSCTVSSHYLVKSSEQTIIYVCSGCSDLYSVKR